MKTLRMDWLDNTSQGKLLLGNLLLSTGLAISDWLRIAQAAGGLIVGIVLVGLAQIFKMWRDHQSWKKEEARKDAIHARMLKGGSPE